MVEGKSKNAGSMTDPKLQEALDYIKDLFARAGLPCPEMKEIPWKDIKKTKAEKRPGEVIVELVIYGEDDE